MLTPNCEDVRADGESAILVLDTTQIMVQLLLDLSQCPYVYIFRKQ
jgi:hypothetical protein